MNNRIIKIIMLITFLFNAYLIESKVKKQVILNINELKSNVEITIEFNKYFNKNGVLLRTEPEFVIALSSVPGVQGWYKNQINILNKKIKPLLIVSYVAGFTLLTHMTSNVVMNILIWNNILTFNENDGLGVTIGTGIATGVLFITFCFLFYSFLGYKNFETKKLKKEAVEKYNKFIKSISISGDGNMYFLCDYMSFEQKIKLGLVVKL